MAMTDWPTELKLIEQGRSLAIAFESGAHYVVTAELLRVESPSAEVKGHGPGQETLQWGKRDVTITRIEPVGNYAVRLTFNDGHSSGIYTWTYLAEVGRDQAALLSAYLSKLQDAGLQR
jgi:DUF971 family protein